MRGVKRIGFADIARMSEADQDLLFTYSAERSRFRFNLLRAFAPLVLCVAMVAVAAMTRGDAELPGWLFSAVDWLQTIMAFVLAGGVVLFGQKAAQHFRNMRQLAAALHGRGFDASALSDDEIWAALIGPLSKK